MENLRRKIIHEVPKTRCLIQYMEIVFRTFIIYDISYYIIRLVFISLSINLPRKSIFDKDIKTKIDEIIHTINPNQVVPELTMQSAYTIELIKGRQLWDRQVNTKYMITEAFNETTPNKKLFHFKDKTDTVKSLVIDAKKNIIHF